MSEIVELTAALIDGGWKMLYVITVVALGFYAVSRGRRAAAVEQAEETRERKAA